MTLATRQAQLIDDLAVIDDPQERLTVLVDRAKKRPPLPAAERTDATRVKGCVSQVWLVGEVHGGRCHFRGDADSPLVRGLVILLCDFYDGADPADAASFEPELLERLGLARNLSPTRLNGLKAVVATIRAFASANA